MVASEGVVQSAPLVVQAMAPGAGRMEEDVARGSVGVMTVMGRTRREPPLGLLSGGSRSPARGKLPVQWMAAQDPALSLFLLDDAAESLEWENLDVGLSAVMGALREASGALREILVPSSWVSA